MNDWWLSAVCAQTDLDACFPERGGKFRDAKRLCDACPVQVECLADALALSDQDDKYGGIRAGTSPAQRKLMRREAA